MFGSYYRYAQVLMSSLFIFTLIAWLGVRSLRVEILLSIDQESHTINMLEVCWKQKIFYFQN